MGGKGPDLVICNSGLSEQGYRYGRALPEEEGESRAQRRVRVRQTFIDNLEEFGDQLTLFPRQIYKLLFRSQRQSKSIAASMRAANKRSSDKTLSALDTLTAAVNAGNNNNA